MAIESTRKDHLVIAERDPGTGQILTSRGLTEKQATFARLFSAGVNRVEAASIAGYASPDVETHRLLALPHVCAAIRQETERSITMDGAQIAWKTMQNLMTDEDTSAQVRFQAAKWTLEAAGMGLAAKAAQMNLASHDKPLAEMTVGELERFLADTEKRVKEAQVIEIPGAPVLNSENGAATLDMARNIAREQAPVSTDTA